MSRKSKTQTGFTIVEVLIVLAIASVIMLLVFKAVPTLRRNSNNTQRRSDATHLASLINEYASNHAGTLPTGFGAGAGLVNISSEKWAIMNAPTTIVNNSTTWGTTSTMVVNTGFTCDTSTNALSAGSSRSFSITFQVETSGPADNACISG